MSDMTDPEALQPVIRTCQIIVAALIMGVVLFLVITLVAIPPLMKPQPALPGEGPGISGMPLITYIATAVGLLNLVLSIIVPKISTDGARRQMALGRSPATVKGGSSEPKQLYPEEYSGKLMTLYQTQLIVGAAILEGGAFFAAIAYMLERNPIAMVTAGVLLGALSARWPTSDRISVWLDRQLALLQEERQSSI